MANQLAINNVYMQSRIICFESRGFSLSLSRYIAQKEDPLNNNYLDFNILGNILHNGTFKTTVAPFLCTSWF